MCNAQLPSMDPSGPVSVSAFPHERLGQGYEPLLPVGASDRVHKSRPLSVGRTTSSRLGTAKMADRMGGFLAFGDAQVQGPATCSTLRLPVNLCGIRLYLSQRYLSRGAEPSATSRCPPARRPQGSSRSGSKEESARRSGRAAFSPARQEGRPNRVESMFMAATSARLASFDTDTSLEDPLLRPSGPSLTLAQRP